MGLEDCEAGHLIFSLRYNIYNIDGFIAAVKKLCFIWEEVFKSHEHYIKQLMLVFISTDKENRIVKIYCEGFYWQLQIQYPG